ncbi:hypothetical protein BG004_006012 [Podila humilis]|nr:hypothetical protein BG004_006012 [Podila humilis]
MFNSSSDQAVESFDSLPHSKHIDWENPETAFRMYISYISLALDVGVLAYHFSTPYHPKFYVKTARRRTLHLHIVSGCMETFYSKDPTKYAYAASFFAVMAHVPSTFYQVPTVLGIRAFLAPSLFLVTLIHGYFAVNLALNPTSFYYLLSSYMTVHIYAWSRVFFALYYRFKLFDSHRFSAAMLTSGMLLMPSVLGLFGNMMLLLFVLLANIALRLIMSADGLKEWTTENPRELASNPEKKAILENLIAAAEVANAVESQAISDSPKQYSQICATITSANMRNMTPKQKALIVFRAIDVNHDNQLTTEELQDFLLACGISVADMKDKMQLDELFAGHKITFEDFCSWFTKNWIHSNSIIIPRLPSTPRGQAKLVFDTLDSDSSGSLDIDELQHLLASWGLPRSEAAGYLQAIDKDMTKGIEFQEFYRGMESIWKFAIQSFIDEGKIRVEN